MGNRPKNTGAMTNVRNSGGFFTRNATSNGLKGNSELEAWSGPRAAPAGFDRQGVSCLVPMFGLFSDATGQPHTFVVPLV